MHIFSLVLSWVRNPNILPNIPAEKLQDIPVPLLSIELYFIMVRAEWLVDVKTMADRIITMRHKLKEGLAKEGQSFLHTVPANIYLSMFIQHSGRCHSLNGSASYNCNSDLTFQNSVEV